MLLVILFVGIVALIIASIIDNKINGDLDWLKMVSAILILSSLVFTAILGFLYSGHSVVDEKIEMYETENTEIEDKIKTIIEEYQKYEKGTYKQYENTSPDVIVSLYPELKSDTLIASQIEIYNQNKTKIKELKEEKLNYKPMAWWLFFGSE